MIKTCNKTHCIQELSSKHQKISPSDHQLWRQRFRCAHTKLGCDVMISGIIGSSQSEKVSPGPSISYFFKVFLSLYSVIVSNICHFASALVYLREGFTVLFSYSTNFAVVTPWAHPVVLPKRYRMLDFMCILSGKETYLRVVLVILFGPVISKSVLLRGACCYTWYRL